MILNKKNILFAVGLLYFSMLWSQQIGDQNDKFAQLREVLPTPNVYRTGAGAPGHKYWQQRADYDINVSLNDEKQSIKATEKITYYNQSPDKLSYLWVQLDQNVREKNSLTYRSATDNIKNRLSFGQVQRYVNQVEYDGGFKIKYVKDRYGKGMDYTIVNTMMKIALKEPLKPKDKIEINIAWSYNIPDQREIGGRSGYEYFKEDDNYLYEMAQWFPRMAVYDDYNGWQNKQFLGRGEFALPFGDYKVSITAPDNHVVTATGVLQNENSVMTDKQKRRMEKAEKSKKPVLIITQEEATENEKTKAKGTKTWVFEAENVRDFAWASSAKFIWDAMGVKISDKTVMAMSFYPKEGNPLWEQYSTEAVAHTLEVYSRYTIDYPYPVAISVNGPVFGMEYPMICFNGPRPEADGTYSERIKYALIGVIIHEVGHNFFPMIINSDERMWTWMDEGLNSFTQYLAEREWEEDYPSRRGDPYKIVPYMSMDKSTMVPIMTNSEQIKQFGNNAYGKPATALNILRETILGRELFDYAYKQYAERWAFKHPQPADLFRTMEDASGVDLDWFWRGWFYTTDHVDISIDEVRWLTIDTKNPEIEDPIARRKRDVKPKTITQIRNAGLKGTRVVDLKPELKDFYNEYDPLETTDYKIEKYQTYYENLSDRQKEILKLDWNFYAIDFSNVGGLVMPIILKLNYKDGSDEVLRLPAEIWRFNTEEITKVVITEKDVESFQVDPYLETADTDTHNNYYPRQMVDSRFDVYKRGRRGGQNPMQIYREMMDKKNKESEKK